MSMSRFITLPLLTLGFLHSSAIISISISTHSQITTVVLMNDEIVTVCGTQHPSREMTRRRTRLEPPRDVQRHSRCASAPALSMARAVTRMVSASIQFRVSVGDVFRVGGCGDKEGGDGDLANERRRVHNIG